MSYESMIMLSPEIGIGSIDWAKLRTEAEPILRNVVFYKNRTVDNVVRINNCIISIERD
jgi:hypothetical protein